MLDRIHKIFDMSEQQNGTPDIFGASLFARDLQKNAYRYIIRKEVN